MWAMSISEPNATAVELRKIADRMDSGESHILICSVLWGDWTSNDCSSSVWDASDPQGPFIPAVLAIISGSKALKAHGVTVESHTSDLQTFTEKLQ